MRGGFDRLTRLMNNKNMTYREKPPEDSDFTQNEWDDLSYDMQYYYYNEERREYLKQKANEITQRNKKYVNKIKKRSNCIDCGEGHIAVLDFHHIDEKSANVSDMVKNEYSIDNIQKEIDKCIILCANCHRKRHYNQKI